MISVWLSPSFHWGLTSDLTSLESPSLTTLPKITPLTLPIHSFALFLFFVQFSSVQSLSCVRLFVTPWIAACQASLSLFNSWSLLSLMSIETVIPSSHLILCRPLPLLPPILPSIRVFSNESTHCMRWPKYWRFSFNISPSNEHPGLISFRMNWLDLLAVQGTLKSLLQHHSSKAPSQASAIHEPWTSRYSSWF